MGQYYVAHSVAKLLALPANIKATIKNLKLRNTLAYFGRVSVTEPKRFMAWAPGYPLTAASSRSARQWLKIKKDNKLVRLSLEKTSASVQLFRSSFFSRTNVPNVTRLRH